MFLSLNTSNITYGIITIRNNYRKRSNNVVFCNFNLPSGVRLTTLKLREKSIWEHHRRTASSAVTDGVRCLENNRRRFQRIINIVHSYISLLAVVRTQDVQRSPPDTHWNLFTNSRLKTTSRLSIWVSTSVARVTTGPVTANGRSTDNGITSQDNRTISQQQKEQQQKKQEYHKQQQQ